MKDGLWGIINGSESAPKETAEGYPKFITRIDHADLLS